MLQHIFHETSRARLREILGNLHIRVGRKQRDGKSQTIEEVHKENIQGNIYIWWELSVQIIGNDNKVKKEKEKMEFTPWLGAKTINI